MGFLKVTNPIRSLQSIHVMLGFTVKSRVVEKEQIVCFRVVPAAVEEVAETHRHINVFLFSTRLALNTVRLFLFLLLQSLLVLLIFY